MSDLQIFLSNLDWRQIAIGAVGGSLTLGLRTLLQAPVKALTQTAFAIRLLALVSPQSPFSGRWEITWNVTSTRLPATNVDQVRIYNLFGNVTFSTITRLDDGTTETCVFVGKIVDRTLTGRWYDPKDQGRGYYGVYQVRLHASLRDGKGSWSGWANDGSVQSDLMTMRQI